MLLDLHFLSSCLCKYKHSVLFRSIRLGDQHTENFSGSPVKAKCMNTSGYPAILAVTIPEGLQQMCGTKSFADHWLAYLDDFLLCAPTREEAERDNRALLSRRSSLGSSVNCTKNIRIKSIWYLKINFVSFRAFLSQERVVTFRQHLTLFHQGNLVSGGTQEGRVR